MKLRIQPSMAVEAGFIVLDPERAIRICNLTDDNPLTIELPDGIQIKIFLIHGEVTFDTYLDPWDRPNSKEVD